MPQFDPQYLDELVKSAGSQRPVQQATSVMDGKIASRSIRVLGGALKVLDYIERPYYGAMNILRDAIGGDVGFSPLKKFKAGITGQEKSSFSDVTTELVGSPTTKVGQVSKFLVDLAGGIALDPATYLTAGTGAALKLGKGAPALNAAGKELFVGEMAKALGITRDTKNFAKAVQSAAPEVFETVIPKVLEIAAHSPEQYYAKSAVRFAGKEIIDLKGASDNFKAVLKPIFDKVVPPEVNALAKGAKLRVGDLFTPYYSILNNKDYTPADKWALINKLENVRAGREEATAKNILGTMEFMKGLNKDERKQITFELEKRLDGMNKTEKAELGGMDDALSGVRKYATEEEFIKSQAEGGIIARSGIPKEIKTNTTNGNEIMTLYHGTSDISAKNILKDGKIVVGEGLSEGQKSIFLTGDKDYAKQIGKNIIEIKIRKGDPFLVWHDDLELEYLKDIDIKSVRSELSDIWKKAHEGTDEFPRFSSNFPEHLKGYVDDIEKEMKRVADVEVARGLRDEASVVEEGYAKRIKLGFKEEVGNRSSSMISRQDEGMDIQQAYQRFKEGKQSWYFEPDSAKWMASRKIESDFSMIKQDTVNWLKDNQFVRSLSKDENSVSLAKEGLETFQYLGKEYAATPDIVKEFSLINKKVTSHGFEAFLKVFDDVQNTWKLSVTSLFPSFHSRNAMSNVFLNYLAGNTDALNYATATRVQWWGRQMENGIKGADQEVMINGQKWMLSDLWRLAQEHGIAGSGWQGGDFLKMVQMKPIGKEALTNPYDSYKYATNQLRKVGTMVENNGRIALFIDRLNKGDNAVQAANTVKKYLFDYGELTVAEREFFKRVIPFYCVPDSSEILTEDGWKSVYQIKKGEKVLTYNVDKNTAEWQGLLDFKTFHHSQELYSLGGKRGKILFTDEHRWVVKENNCTVKGRRYGGNTKIVKGVDLNSWHSVLMVPENVAHRDESLLTTEEAELLGWLITDGYWRFRGNHCEAMIYQSPKKFLDIVKRVAGGKPRKAHPGSGVVCVPVLKERLVKIAPLLKDNNFSSVPTKLSRESLEALYNAMYLADGSVELNRGSRDSKFLACTKKPVLDTFTTTCFLLGKRTREGARGTYISDKKTMKVAGALNREFYEGVVWCPSTKNGTWVMRQNGIITITGNTWLRKNIPLQVEGVLKSPGRYSNLMHFQSAQEDMTPAQEEQYLPDWMKNEEMFVRTGPKNYYNPDLPFQDLANMFSLKKWISGTSPLIKGFFELTANKNFYTGQDLANTNLPASAFEAEKMKNWILSQMRITSFWKKATEKDRTSFQYYIDFLFGLRTYNYDIPRAKKASLQRKVLEKRALKKLDKDEIKAQQEARQGVKTIMGL